MYDLVGLNLSFFAIFRVFVVVAYAVNGWELLVCSYRYGGTKFLFKVFIGNVVLFVVLWYLFDWLDLVVMV